MRRGGSLRLYNDVLGVLIGRTGRWDQVAVMEYAGTDAFVDMIRDPGYQAALVHHDAGLDETVVLVSRSLLRPAARPAAPAGPAPFASVGPLRAPAHERGARRGPRPGARRSPPVPRWAVSAPSTGATAG